MPQPHVAAWTGEQRALWARIEAHVFDPGTPLGFLPRLARDKDWSPRFARGAVEEYRRFCFLCTIAPQPVTPSEEVDEVWHQHLTYTRDYWDIWCGQVLRARLHHDPTGGTPAEQTMFRAQYAATLALYEQYFGPPPEAYWPGTRARFRPVPRFRTYDAARALLLPRPSRLWRRES